MNPKLLHVRRFAVFAILTFGAVALCTASEVQDRIEKTFEPGSGGNLIMDLDRGSIEIKSVPGSVVHIEVIRKAEARTRNAAEAILKKHEIQFHREGSEVQVRARNEGEKPFRLWNLRERLQVQYLVSVPAKFNVDLKTGGGAISISDLDGKVKASTSGGSLKFGNISGPIVGRTSGGSVTVQSCRDQVEVETSGGSLNIGEVSGPVSARSSGGSIRIDRAKGNVIARTSGGSIDVSEVIGNIQASTSGGSVSARLSTQPGGNCELKTSGGNVEIALPENVAVDLDASTRGGRVIADFPSLTLGEQKRSLKAKLNGGGPALVLHTSGGNVRIRKN